MNCLNTHWNGIIKLRIAVPSYGTYMHRVVQVVHIIYLLSFSYVAYHQHPSSRSKKMEKPMRRDIFSCLMTL